MTTPEQARGFADVIEDNPIAFSDRYIAEALRNLANQVERLEAQRKELREALERARNQLDEDCFTDENKTECLKAVYAALKATE